MTGARGTDSGLLPLLEPVLQRAATTVLHEARARYRFDLAEPDSRRWSR